MSIQPSSLASAQRKWVFGNVHVAIVSRNEQGASGDIDHLFRTGDG
jgi:hypothetical protein